MLYNLRKILFEGETASRQLILLISAMLLIIAVIVAAGLGGIAVVDSIRSYATGGMHYAKSHLSAVAVLRRFARSGLEEDFVRYEHRIYVAVSDRVAREILEQPDLDGSNSYPFLIGGKNHPSDSHGIAWLFRSFHDTDLFRPAVETWRTADREIQRLDQLADDLYRAVRSAGSEPAARAPLLAEIDDIDERLLELEEQFALQLGVAARSVSQLLTWSLVGLGLSLSVLLGTLGFLVERRIRNADRLVKEREQRFRDVADVAGDWIWETDDRYRFTYLSRRLEEIIGVPVSYFIGRNRRESAAVDDPDLWRRHFEDLDARKPFRGFEYCFRHPHGGRRFFRINGKPMFDSQGRFIGYRGTGSDISQEVEARAQLLEKQVLLETTFESMAQGISVVDDDLTALAFNRRFLDLLDFPANEFRPGDPFEKFVRYNAERGEYGKGDIETLVEQRVAQARRFEPHHIERVRPNGRVVEIQGIPMPRGGFVTTYTDVTERHRAAREIDEARRVAEAANRTKSVFLATMSHELRTPLNAIIGFADIMVQGTFGKLPDRYAEYVRDIRGSGEHLMAIISDILDLTKIEAGHVDIRVEPVSPYDLVEVCLRIAQRQAMSESVDLRNDVSRDCEPILADQRQIRQILLNLVGNAIKFSHQGGTVSVGYVEVDGFRGLRVADQGIGIPRDKMDRVFEPFAQLESGHERRYEGAGLGLSLVRRLMDMHDGTVDIDSDPGQGTRVTILFPHPMEQVWPARVLRSGAGD